MDTGVIITALFILAIAVLPFAGYSMVTNMRRNRLLQALTAQAQSAGTQITQPELLNHLAMATDATQHWLFFAKRTQGKYHSYALNLPGIANCRVETITKSEPGHEGVFTISTQRVEIHFTLKEGSTAPIVWQLYNSVNDGTILRGEPEFADRWCTFLQSVTGVKKR